MKKENQQKTDNKMDKPNNLPNKQEMSVPLVVPVGLEESSGLMRYRKFNFKDFNKRLELALLEHPEFRPPFTTNDMPACIVGYKVEPKRGFDLLHPEYRFTLHIDIVPGNRMYDYEREQGH